MEAEAILALVVLLLAGVGSLSWTPLGRALIERLRRPAAPPDPALSREVLAELQELRRPAAPPDPALSREVLAELQELRREVAELSERMDFTEQLLAQPREAQR